MAGPSARMPIAGDSNPCADPLISYDHRVQDPDNYNWCVIPGTGADALIFAFLAIAIFCCVQGKLSAIWVMLIGGILEAWSYYYNTRQLSNAFAYWIGISPPDLFMYGFLPPLLLNSSLRIDFFLFKKVLISALSLAFLVVLASLALCTFPLLAMLPDWEWPHAALFIALLAPTDAVAVAAILRTAGAPEVLCVLLEGESLFNDASAVVLFDVFEDTVKELSKGEPVSFSLETVTTIGVKILVMGGGGLVVGLIGGFVIHRLLWMLRRLNRMDDFNCVELALVLAGSNLVFYIANAPLKLSGPVAVAVFGLYGAAFSGFEVDPRMVSSGVYDAFWETVCFCLNGIVFFYSGIAVVNFFIRSQENFDTSEGLSLVWTTWGMLPVIYILNFAARGVCIAFFSFVLGLKRQGLDFRGQLFTTFTGLRGALSLVLLQTVVTTFGIGESNTDPVIITQMVVWSAGFVLLTLVVNAPFIGSVLSATGLNRTSEPKLAIRRKAWRALRRFTDAAIHDLQQDGDEIMRGVDWAIVRQYLTLKGGPGKAPAAPSAKRSSTDQQQQQQQQQQSREGPSALGVMNYLRNTMHRLGPTGAAGEAAAAAASSSSGDLRQPFVAGSSSSSIGGSEEPLLGGTEGGRGGDSVADAPIWPLGRSETAATSSSLEEEDLPGTGGGSSSPKDLMEFFGAEGRQDSDDPYALDEALEATSPSSTVSDPEPHQGPSSSQSSSPGTPRMFFGRAATHEGLHQEPQHSPLSRQASSGRYEEVTLSADVGRGLQEELHRALQEQSSTYGSCHQDGPDDQGRESLPELQRSSSSDQLSPFSFPQAQQEEGQGMRGGNSSINPLDSVRRSFFSRDVGGISFSSASKSMRKNTSASKLQRMVSEEVSVSVHEPPSTSPRSGPFVASTLDPSTLPADADEVLSEARVRLLNGMKRYFRTKRAEGLLSYTGLRILEAAADTCIEDKGSPIRIFQVAKKDLASNSSIGGLLLTSLAAATNEIGRAAARSPALLRRLEELTVRPLRVWAHQSLSFQQLLAIETAIECWLALRMAPSQGWLHAILQRDALEAEVAEELSRASDFLLMRELEAPRRFRAIQTYRATVSVLTRAEHFVHELESTGMIDEADAEILQAPVKVRQRMLQNQGPNWKLPNPRRVLRELPFLVNLPDETVNRLFSAGRLKLYKPGEVLYDSRSSEPMGLFIVLSGLVAGRNVTEQQQQQQQQQGPSVQASAAAQFVRDNDVYYSLGATFGLFSCLLPGQDPVWANPAAGGYQIVAYGKQVARGPLMFCVTRDAFDGLRQEARAGHHGLQKLELNLFRLLSAMSIASSWDQLVLQLLEEEELLRRFYGVPGNHTDADVSGSKQGHYEGADLLSYWMTEDGIGGIERQRQPDPEPSDLAASYLLELSKQVQSASLLELEPKQGMHQRSTVILLRGSVNRFTYVKQQQNPKQKQQRYDHADSNDGTGGWECIEECFEAPHYLFWWGGGDFKDGHCLMSAGRSGALLMEFKHADARSETATGTPVGLLALSRQPSAMSTMTSAGSVGISLEGLDLQLTGAAINAAATAPPSPLGNAADSFHQHHKQQQRNASSSLTDDAADAAPGAPPPPAAAAPPLFLKEAHQPPFSSSSSSSPRHSQALRSSEELQAAILHAGAPRRVEAEGTEGLEAAVACRVAPEVQYHAPPRHHP